MTRATKHEHHATDDERFWATIGVRKLSSRLGMGWGALLAAAAFGGAGCSARADAAPPPDRIRVSNTAEPEVGNGSFDASETFVPAVDASLEADSFSAEQDACAEVVGTSFTPRVVLEMLLDTSRSMSTLVGNLGETRLTATTEAINSVLATVAAQVQVGVMRYPGGEFSASECLSGELLAAPAALGAAGSAQREMIRSRLANIAPEGETPTLEGLLLGLRYLELQGASSQRFMILITDGAPTVPAAQCPTDGSVEEQLAQAVDLARQQNVRTFVIGAPGSEHAAATLSDLAVRGGTARVGCGVDGVADCHYDVTRSLDFFIDIEGALTDVTRAVTACRYDLPAAPVGQELQRDLVNLRYFSEQGEIAHDVLQDAAAVCTEGWRYVGDQIELCPATCDQVQNDPDNRVEILLGCASRVVVR